MQKGRSDWPTISAIARIGLPQPSSRLPLLSGLQPPVLQSLRRDVMSLSSAKASATATATATSPPPVTPVCMHMLMSIATVAAATATAHFPPGQVRGLKQIALKVSGFKRGHLNPRFFH